MLVYNKTDIGLVRKSNEDSYISLPPHFLMVADGMGGHAAGEIASSRTATIVADYIATEMGNFDGQTLLRQAIEQANKQIYEMAQAHSEYAGMGTTITALYIEGNVVYWGHVGDSRLYMLHDSDFNQLTQDHSLVGELLRNGSITKEEAEHHPNRNILTRAIGTSLDVEVDTGYIHWQLGDSVLLCTDGLTALVSDNDIKQKMIGKLPQDGQQVLAELFSQALEAGGYDNITAVLAYCD